jgi:hypothetical protein
LSLRIWLCCVSIAACAGGERFASELPGGSTGPPLDFAFGALDGSVVTAEGSRGRVTALLFVTTYDLPSHAAARRLDEVLTRHKPRFNAAAVVLESAENAVLADTFGKSLGLSYPVALADAVELRSSSAFSQIDRVPTLVLLDRRGRAYLRRSGLFETQDLEAWLEGAESER